MKNSEIYINGMIGLAVGDALGVPVEFQSRWTLKDHPVTGLRGYGTHYQPPGTWSDDSSLALACLDSLRGGISYADMLGKFSSWLLDAEYTATGKVFDVGNTTEAAIQRFQQGTNPLKCGGHGDMDNGNGGLMRILPICIYCFLRQKQVCTSEDEAIQTVHNICGLTHGNIRSQMSCGLYYFMVKSVLEGQGDLRSRLQAGLDKGFSYYRRDLRNMAELENFSRLTDLEKFAETEEEDIRSTGYVVDTLEAAVWCLITSSSYEESVLKAVNLGDDTDTVGAVTGGLAGLYYGYEQIPEEWREGLARREWIESLCLAMDKKA